MSQTRIIDFLPGSSATLDRGSIFAEAGRAIEAGHGAPPPISLAQRLAIVTVLMLPVLWHLADAGLLSGLRSWLQQPFLVWS